MLSSVAIASAAALVGGLVVLNVWLFVGSRAATATLAAVLDVSIAILVGYTPAGGLPTKVAAALGVFVLTLFLFQIAHFASALALGLLGRLGNSLASYLLAPVDIEAAEADIDTDSDNPDLSSAPWRYRAAVSVKRASEFCKAVLTDYFLSNETIVGSDPWYYRWLQRRAYFHADVDEVNYHLQWLADHHDRGDEDAKEHVQALQRELETDRLWSP